MTTCGASHKPAWDFTLTTLEGKPLPLHLFRGRVVLLVNTASECGFSAQFAELESLWRKFRHRGLIVIGVPSDDFGHQEPGDAPAIARFCQARFGVTFPMCAKSHVRGASALPIYKWAAEQTYFRPRWNFHKYLIDRNGELAASFLSWTRPDNRRVLRAIERELDRRPKNSASSRAQDQITD